MHPNYEDDSPLPNSSRQQVARDMLVFQAKLFTDGLKDLMLSPMALIAGLVGIFLGRGNPGVPLYELLRYGRKVESWIDLFAAAYTKPSKNEDLVSSENDNNEKSDQETAATSQDFDALLDRLQSTLLDPDARARISDRSKTQLDAIAKKLRRE